MTIVKRVSGAVLVLIVLFGGATVTDVAAQTFSEKAFTGFLYQPGLEYENLAIDGYRRYGRSMMQRSTQPLYDAFGNFIADGIQVFHMRETRRSIKDLADREYGSMVQKLSPYDSGEYYADYLYKLVVINEDQKDFSTRLMVGDNIRTKFSPLVLDMASLNGIRWDMDLRDNLFTMVASRADRPIWMSSGGETGYRGQGTQMEMHQDKHWQCQFSTYLLGGHWERQLGIFNVAASYVNQYRVDSNVSMAQNSLKGVIPIDEAPTAYLVLKFSDGTPHDGHGTKIFKVRYFLDGKEITERYGPPNAYGQPGYGFVGITRSNEDFDREYTKLGHNVEDQFYTNNRDIRPKRIPPFADFMIDENAGTHKNLEYVTPEVGLEANGEEYLLYWFRMNEEQQNLTNSFRDARFEVLVGNDYKVEISEVWAYTVKHSTPRGNYYATFYETVAESKGNVQDLSNIQWVKFRHGRQTSNMLASLRLDADVRGFKFSGEIVKNYQYYMFNNVMSKRYREDTASYYFNLRKDFGRYFSFGTEYFNFSPTYKTELSVTAKNYETFTSLPTAPWTSFFDGNSMAKYYNFDMELDTVDDNDDKDRYDSACTMM